MNRLARILRHRWLDQSDVRRALPADALARLTERVAASERHHSGEIRICVEAGLPWSYLWKGLPARARALTLFGKLRVWDTERNNGVLIYLLMAEHTIEIVADRGLNAYAGEAQWAVIIEHLSAALREGQFEQGLNAAVDAMDELLHAHFARRAGEADRNELPDAPLVI
jgi:uncharacterized membrane protein